MIEVSMSDNEAITVAVVDLPAALELRARRLYAEVRALLRDAERLDDEEHWRVVSPLGYACDLIGDAGGRRWARPLSALVDLREILWHLGDDDIQEMWQWAASRCMHPSYVEIEMPPALPAPIAMPRELRGNEAKS